MEEREDECIPSVLGILEFYFGGSRTARGGRVAAVGVASQRLTCFEIKSLTFLAAPLRN